MRQNKKEKKMTKQRGCRGGVHCEILRSREDELLRKSIRQRMSSLIKNESVGIENQIPSQSTTVNDAVSGYEVRTLREASFKNLLLQTHAGHLLMRMCVAATSCVGRALASFQLKKLPSSSSSSSSSSHNHSYSALHKRKGKIQERGFPPSQKKKKKTSHSLGPYTKSFLSLSI